ncbi:retinol dehydrogenase [Nitzschia inconspicua]|uniref:Retinol dehydrogenase n=1 Tax=Nitzschia inconspicua TaxID=303405 RepID=A0A9K3PKL1_9STRA|nr:retinol dehydrogenase [Nitzschia inconspicua]
MSFAVVDIVTGSTHGIGKAIAESIAHHRKNATIHELSSYRLVLVGRNEERGNQVAASIREETNIDVIYETCDLSEYRSVLTMKRKILQDDNNNNVKVGILVNNAAECPQQQQFVQRPRKMSDGTVVLQRLDKQFASNVLGYHFMLRAFSTAFTTSTRVVNVASNWAGDMDLNDLQFERRRYDNDSAYRQSKQCDRMLSIAWAKKLRHCKVNACHPGDPCTVLSRALGYNLYASVPTRQFIDRSGVIPFLCGLDPSGDVISTGSWYDGSKEPKKDRFASSLQTVEALFDECESYCVEK